MKLTNYWVAGAGMLTLGLNSGLAFADDTEDRLRDKLRNIDTLSAQFEQRVYDEREQLQEELQGDLILKRPHYLRWETQSPDHSIMVADGEAVWYYNAFVEQLSIFDQAQDLEQNPMLVLLSDDEAAWSSFAVTQESNEWVIAEQGGGYSQAKLALTFDEDDRLYRLRMDDGQGQVSVFELSNVVLNEPVAANSFQLDAPEGADIDDQRSR